MGHYCAIVRSYRALIVTCSSFPPAHAFTRDDDVDACLEGEVYIYILKRSDRLLLGFRG